MREEQFATSLTDEDGSEPARVVSIPRAQVLLGGITYRQVGLMIQHGKLQSIKVGSRRMVVKKSIDEYLDGCFEKAGLAVSA